MSQKLISRLIVKFGILVCIIGLFAAFVPAQAQQWFYVARDTDGGRFFVQKKVDSLENNENRGMWTKIIYPDWSWKTGYDEWDCKKRKFRTKQVSSYTNAGKLIRTERNLDWVLVTPEAVSEVLFEEACGKPSEVKYAVIQSARAELRDNLGVAGKVVRIIKREEKFPLTSIKSKGPWYQIYDPQTLIEYWLNGNTFKIE